MKKAIIHFYSRGNLGDDLFVKIITERYRNSFSVVPIGKSNYLRSLKNLRAHANGLTFYLYKLSEKVLRKRNLLLLKLARTNDLLIHVGGSIFQEGADLNKWRLEERFYKRLPIPYYIIGSSVGPYRSPEFLKILKRIFQGAQDVCFRDQSSFKLFPGLRATRAATDIAFSLDVSKHEVKNEKLAIFSIVDCSSQFDEETAALYERTISELTSKFVRKGYRVIYMSFCKYEGDETAIRKIHASLDQPDKAAVTIFNYDGNLEAALSLIASSSIVVASRFHATILGLLFGRRVLPIIHGQKTANILSDIGFEGPRIITKELDVFDASLFDPEMIAAHDVSSQIKLAEQQFKELDKVLVRR